MGKLVFTNLCTMLFIVALNYVAVTTAHSADYVVDTNVSTTNGGNTLDGDDSLTITSSGSISTSTIGVHSVAATGNNNIINNSGSISIIGLQDDDSAISVTSGTNNKIINSGSIITSTVGAFIDSNHGMECPYKLDTI